MSVNSGWLPSGIWGYVLITHRSAPDIGHGLVQDADALVYLGTRQNQRRRDLQYVAPGAGVEENQTELPAAVDNFGREDLIRFFGFPIGDQIDAADHAPPTDVANFVVFAQGL